MTQSTAKRGALFIMKGNDHFKERLTERSLVSLSDHYLKVVNISIIQKNTYGGARGGLISLT